MKKKLIGLAASILAISLIFSSVKSTEAISYYGHDGSVSEYLEKVVVKPYSNKKDTWVYIVKACATDHNLGVAAVVLKSDIDREQLGVSKSIVKGNCSHYGAVMKAKDGDTLGAELILTHEALEKYQGLVKSIPEKSTQDIKSTMKEISFYRSILGGLV
jgi:hypothetical protein